MPTKHTKYTKYTKWKNKKSIEKTLPVVFVCFVFLVGNICSFFFYFVSRVSRANNFSSYLCDSCFSWAVLLLFSGCLIIRPDPIVDFVVDFYFVFLSCPIIFCRHNKQTGNTRFVFDFDSDIICIFINYF